MANVRELMLADVLAYCVVMATVSPGTSISEDLSLV